MTGPSFWSPYASGSAVNTYAPLAARTVFPFGTHIGETLLGEEQEEPAPPYFMSRIPTGDGRALTCAYFVRPDERSVQCIDLKWE